MFLFIYFYISYSYQSYNSEYHSNNKTISTPQTYRISIQRLHSTNKSVLTQTITTEYRKDPIRYWSVRCWNSRLILRRENIQSIIGENVNTDIALSPCPHASSKVKAFPFWVILMTPGLPQLLCLEIYDVQGPVILNIVRFVFVTIHSFPHSSLSEFHISALVKFIILKWYLQQQYLGYHVLTVNVTGPE